MDCIITVVDIDKSELTALQKCLQVVCHQQPKTATIMVAPRKPSGWLEYGVRVDYAGGGGMFIAVIQRTEGAEFESHS